MERNNRLTGVIKWDPSDKPGSKMNNNHSVSKAYILTWNCKHYLLRTSYKRFIHEHAHVEWDGSEFVPTKPEPSPRLQGSVNASINAWKLGVDWKGSRVGSYDPKELDGIADTGCQTCTGGADILRDLKCPSLLNSHITQNNGNQCFKTWVSWSTHAEIGI